MDLLKNFLMNTQAKYSISRPFEAEQISKFICDNMRKINLEPSNCTITDATAGVGGDSIKFSKYFKYVNSVEIDLETYELLNKNIERFNIKNIKTYKADYLNIMSKLKQDVIYIDFPWGGVGYKNKSEVYLYLGTMSIDQIITQLFLNNNNLIFIKVPFNVKIDLFKRYITDETTIINKMGRESFKILKLEPMDKINIKT